MGCNQELHSPGKPSRCACYLLSELTNHDWETWEKTYINGNSVFTSHVPITSVCQINVHLTEIPVSLWNLGHFSKFKARSPEPRIAVKNIYKENKHQSLKLHTVEGCQKCNFFSKGNPMPSCIQSFTHTHFWFKFVASSALNFENRSVKETSRMLVGSGLPSNGGHMG